jgi:DNA polymerase III subunit epsilon
VTFARWLLERLHPEMARDDERWVVLDTETSGLDPLNDQLLAIGAMAVDPTGIRLDDSFEVVLRVAPVGDRANVAIHGIGHDAQRAGIPPTEALAAFTAFVAGAPCAGFHCEFDRIVLAKAAQTAGVPLLSSGWLDVAQLAAAVAPETYYRGSRSLDDWLHAFDIEVFGRHNAAGDALATAELLLRLRALAARQQVSGFAALVRLSQQRRWLGSTNAS